MEDFVDLIQEMDISGEQLARMIQNYMSSVELEEFTEYVQDEME